MASGTQLVPAKYLTLVINVLLLLVSGRWLWLLLRWRYKNSFPFRASLLKQQY